MDYTTDTLRAAVVDAALKGGEMLRHYFGAVSRVRTKASRYDLVTEADEQIEKELTAYIRQHFPDHRVVGEEQFSRQTQPRQGLLESYMAIDDPEQQPWTWLIDPIDGTTNFIHKMPLVATSVAVVYRDKVVAGAVFNPVLDELFVAVHSEGATLNGRPLRVSQESRLTEGLLGTGFHYDVTQGKWLNVDLVARSLDVARNVRVIGSAALSLCYVGAGRLSGYWELQLRPWDLAAGALVVWEAGGQLTCVDGRPFNVWQTSVVATNGRIHAELVRVLKNSVAG